MTEEPAPRASQAPQDAHSPKPGPESRPAPSRPPEGDTAPRCPAQTGPVWKADGEPCGCTLDDGHDGDHQCSCGAWWVDSTRRDRPHV